MGVFTVDGKNEMLLACTIQSVGLFLGSPASGGVEVSGGGYTRQPITLVAPDSGQINVTDDVTFQIPAGANFDYVGYFGGSGELLGYDDVPAEVYGSSGQYTLTATTFSL